ncbi:hypothetical protein GARC_3997 [Paraglaciecola arctica BSs20135]|uniref:Uncharacterized protein n=1 Tax=Paraglaciecola arctica BSs20135 TaxID=493475 RepID=K6XJV7_9ALTE|nr:hypothetical protein GARC_3997 [Paraglaciecola arctica BSs20135]
MQQQKPVYSRRRVQQVSLAAQQRLAEQRAKEGEFGKMPF